MKTRISALVLVGILVAMIGGALLWRERQRLRAQNEALRAEISELQARGQKEAGKPEERQAADFEKERRELLALRNEVAQLRAGREAAKRAEEELARVRANQDNGGRMTAATVGEGERIASADWKFGGYETPQAALVSGLWAMREGQVASLLETFTPEERQRLEAQMQGKSETEIAQRFQKEFGRVTGLRVVAQHETVPGEVVLDVYLEGLGFLKKFRMNEVNGGWKAGAPINQNFSPSVPDSYGSASDYYQQNSELIKQSSTTKPLDPSSGPMAYYMQNPELMKRYFPQLYQEMQRRQQQGGNATAGTAP
jgi:hypothetical protein